MADDVERPVCRWCGCAFADHIEDMDKPGSGPDICPREPRKWPEHYAPDPAATLQAKLDRALDGYAPLLSRLSIYSDLTEAGQLIANAQSLIKELRP